MTVGKAAALTVGFVGAVALGVAIGPSARDGMSDIANRTHAGPAMDSKARATEQARPAADRPRAKAAPAPVAKVKSDTDEGTPVAVAANAVRANEPRVQQRLKPVLNRGANMQIAAQGFLTAEEFATVAHAARNTQVPFMVLKHRVISEKQPMTESVADAIREFKPELDAKAEVARAQRQAREDLAALSD